MFRLEQPPYLSVGNPSAGISLLVLVHTVGFWRRIELKGKVCTLDLLIKRKQNLGGVLITRCCGPDENLADWKLERGSRLSSKPAL